MSIDVEVQATIGALGYLEAGQYFKEPDCFESVRDLIRFLKKDRVESCPIRRLLTGSRVIDNDLIPILKTFPQEGQLFDVALRLLINLTLPPELCFGTDGAIVSRLDKATLPFCREIVLSLQRSKLSFADDKLLAVLAEKVKNFIQLEWEDRDEDDRLVIERIFALIRNVLYIPAPELDKKRTDADETVQDRVLSSIHNSGFEDVLLMIAGNHAESQFHIRVLEIISLMLKDQSAADVAWAGETKNEEERQRQLDKWEAIRQQEEAKKKTQKKRFSARHTNFAGSYTIRGLKAVDQKSDLVSHRVVNNNKTTHPEWIEDRKVAKRPPKNQRPAVSIQTDHRSTYKFRIRMRAFCCQFLNDCYNSLMRSAKQLLNQRRDHMSPSSLRQDDSHYLRVMRFLMEFRRVAHLPFNQIKDTISVQMFHYAQTQIENCLEMATTNKAEATIWGQRASLALSAYKELLYTLQSMEKDDDERVRTESETIKQHIFYTMEYRDICLQLLKKYNPVFLSKVYLRELIETNHLFLRMLEKYCQIGTVVVMKRRKKPPRRKRKERQQQTEENDENRPPEEPSEDDLEQRWERQNGQMCELLQGHITLPDDQIPFDATMQVDEDTHKKVAMGRIQKALREERPADAVALYRASRQLWPEDDIFGAEDIEPEHEFMEMREILFADIENVEQNGGGKNTDVQPTDNDLFANEMDDENEEEEDEEMDTGYIETETEFNFTDYMHRFARPDVLKWFVSLLSDFDTNSKDLNHMIVKLLYRVMSEMDQSPLLYQVQLFRVLQRIGQPSYKDMKSVAEAREFGKRLLRQFFKDANENNKIFLELLFWKGPRESYELQHGYGSFETRPSTHGAGRVWPEELELEVRSLNEEFEALEEKPENLDVVDYIESHLSQHRERRQIIRKMRELGLDTFGIKIRPGRALKTNANLWPEELDFEFRSLYEEYKAMEQKPEDEDISDYIERKLSLPRARRQILRRFRALEIDITGLMKKKSKGQLWTDILLTELQSLYEEYLMMPEEEKTKGRDVADYIVEGLSVSKPRNQVISKMEELGLDISSLRKIKRRKPKTNQIDHLLETNRDVSLSPSPSPDSANSHQAPSTPTLYSNTPNNDSANVSPASKISDNDDSPIRHKKRKLVLPDSPEVNEGVSSPIGSPQSNNAEVGVSSPVEAHVESPMRQTKKRKLVISSDSEED